MKIHGPFGLIAVNAAEDLASVVILVIDLVIQTLKRLFRAGPVPDAAVQFIVFAGRHVHTKDLLSRYGLRGKQERGPLFSKPV